MGKPTLVTVFAITLEPGGTGGLVIEVTACPFANSSPGKVATANLVSDVADWASWRGPTAKRVVDMCVGALAAATALA